METLGNRIKQLRKEKQLTQPQLADALNVSKSVISFWENDINEPKASYMVSLASFFKVSTDYLLGIESEDGRIIIQEPELPSDEKKLLEEYRALSPELKSLSRDYFKSLNALNNSNSNNRNNNDKN